MNKIFTFLLLSICWLSCANQSKPIVHVQAQPEKVTILDSLLNPWSIAFIDDEEVLITEKNGNLVQANLKTKQRSVISGFPSDLVDSIGEVDFRDNSGIFEVVLHPKFDDNNFIYISYAAESIDGTTTKIIRAKLEDHALVDVQDIFVADPYRRDLFHYGGGMTFGKDGKLYFTIGERYYNEIDQPDLPVAQDVNDKRGKIHRLNDDGSVPEDNPIFEGGKRSSIYALGIRAAQGITSNPRNGDIWFSEHGSMQGDELNILEKGANYGWPIKTTGKYRNSDFKPASIEGITFVDPKHYWWQTIAPTGLTFYEGNEFPQWHGDIILSGLSRGSLWRINMENNEVVSLEELFVNDRVRSRKVAMSPSGKLYLLTDEKNGKLIEIRNAAPSAQS